MYWVKQKIGYWCDEIRHKKALGQEIGIAVLDTGISLHPDVKDRISGFRDEVGRRLLPYDDNGHGTHVAGILAGKRDGMAPLADLIVCKVLDANGDGSVRDMLCAIRWILGNQERYHIRVVNISAGMSMRSDEPDERAMIEGVEMLWDAGLVVVAAAGNRGPGKSTVTTPGTSSKVITVGSVPGERQRSRYSGEGPTRDCVCKPDLLAPGTRIFSCNHRYGSNHAPRYVEKSGTSMSTPVVAGAIADLLSLYPDMTNVEVKLRLRKSCRDLGLPVNQQGQGMIDIPALFRG